MNRQAASAMIQGLSEDDVRLRQEEGQSNKVTFQTSRSYRQILVENTFMPIHNILFILGAALVLLGRVGDAIFTVGVISLNIIISVIQEVRAKRQLDQIALLNRPAATVIRDAMTQTIDPDEIVLGDILVVTAGDQILVDGAVVGPGQINVDESLLTGESDLVPKHTGDLVYSGSFCVSGSAMYEAQRVGAQSTANRLAEGARTFRRVLTPMQREINTILQLLLGLAGYLVAVIFIFTMLDDVPLVASVSAATVVVGLVPNSLLLAIAVAYALSAVRLARQGVLVQQANAVESLSNVDMLCVDKTGTLTANRLQVQAIYPIGMSLAELEQQLGAYASSGAAGNATSEAIATAYPAPQRPVSTEIPFSSARKWSALAFADDPSAGLSVLGAPEMLLPFVTTDHALDAQIVQWTEQGLRVLLLARYDHAVDLQVSGMMRSLCQV